MRYALDTNIFIDGLRNEKKQTEILAFLDRALPFVHLSAVVMQELAAGARTIEAAHALRKAVFRPFERRGRVFVPSSAAFVSSGRVLASVAAKDGWPLVDANPSLRNDALIAASCREQGITLITKDRDFERIAPFLKACASSNPGQSPGRNARLCAAPRRAADTWDRSEVLVDRGLLALRHVAERGPRHHLQQIEIR